MLTFASLKIYTKYAKRRHSDSEKLFNKEHAQVKQQNLSSKLLQKAPFPLLRQVLENLW